MSEEQAAVSTETTPVAEPSVAESLLAKHTTSEDVSEPDVASEATGESESDVVDSSEKLLGGRFKTAEALEKGYLEARKMLSEKGKIAPDEYSLELPEGVEISSDDPLLAKFGDFAKENNLSNEMYNEIVKMKLESEAGNSVDPKAEMEKLGSNAGELINGITSFYQNKLSEDGFKSVQNFATTAENVMVLDELRKSFGGTTVPTSKAVKSASSAPSLAQAEALIAQARTLHESGKIEEAAVIRNKAKLAFEQIYA